MLERVNAVENVRRHLLRLIDLGQFAPGERLLSAAEIAEQVGMSRPVVLQAAKLLESEGRIVIRHGGGMWVRPLSANNVDIRRARVWRDRFEIVQHNVLREMLEAGAARRLAELGLPADAVAAARALNEGMRATTDPYAWRRLDTEFHAVTYLAIGMPLIEQTLFNARAIASSAFEFLPWPSNGSEKSYDEHEGLLRAIEARDPVSAEEVARAHIRRSSVLIADVLGGDDPSRLAVDRFPTTEAMR